MTKITPTLRAIIVSLRGENKSYREIQRLLKEEMGETIAFTTIRYALNHSYREDMRKRSRVEWGKVK